MPRGDGVLPCCEYGGASISSKAGLHEAGMGFVATTLLFARRRVCKSALRNPTCDIGGSTWPQGHARDPIGGGWRPFHFIGVSIPAPLLTAGCQRCQRRGDK